MFPKPKKTGMIGVIIMRPCLPKFLKHSKIKIQLIIDKAKYFPTFKNETENSQLQSGLISKFFNLYRRVLRLVKVNPRFLTS